MTVSRATECSTAYCVDSEKKESAPVFVYDEMHTFFILLHNTFCRSILSNFHLNYNIFYYCCFHFKKLHLFYLFILLLPSLITRKVAKEMWSEITSASGYATMHTALECLCCTTKYIQSTKSIQYTVWRQVYTHVTRVICTWAPTAVCPRRSVRKAHL